MFASADSGFVIECATNQTNTNDTRIKSRPVMMIDGNRRLLWNSATLAALTKKIPVSLMGCEDIIYASPFSLMLRVSVDEVFSISLKRVLLFARDIPSCDLLQSIMLFSEQRNILPVSIIEIFSITPVKS